MIRFMWKNLWDIGTLTASSEDPNFPASNTRNRWYTRTWRSTSVAGTEWLKVDLGFPQRVAAFIIKFHNFTSGAVVKLQGNNADDWTAPGYEAVLPINQHIIVHFFNEMSLQYWRVTIEDTSNSNGYIEIGRVFLGSYFEPTRNFVYGNAFVIDDDSLLVMSEGGQISAIKKKPYLRFIYSFRALPKTDIQIFKEIFFERGLSRDMFICEDPEDAQNTTFYVRFACKIMPVNVFADYYDLKIELEELR